MARSVRMKLLSLVRHADSDAHTMLPDRERPLNERGARDAADMPQRWRARKLTPDLLLSSPAVRAHQTAGGFAAGFGIARHDIRLDERLYLAAPGDLVQIIHETLAGIGHLMVFGHNPGISALARMLCSRSCRSSRCRARRCAR